MRSQLFNPPKSVAKLSFRVPTVIRTTVRGWLTVSIPVVQLEHFVATLSGAHAVRFLNREYEQLAVARLARAGVSQHGFHDLFHIFVTHDHLDLNFVRKVDRILRAPERFA